jgi:hypothetical protein
MGRPFNGSEVSSPELMRNTRPFQNPRRLFHAIDLGPLDLPEFAPRPLDTNSDPCGKILCLKERVPSGKPALMEER